MNVAIANGCPSHDLERQEGNSEERLPRNFIVYNNGQQQLVFELNRYKKEFNAQEAFASIQREQSHIGRGNIEELAH